TLPGQVVQRLINKTDGVPLFVEELTKMVLESGLLKEQEGHYELINPLPSLVIPTTLRDSLMARLDRLTTAKEVAQLGATLGREFSYELIQAVSPLDEATLQKELTQLVKAELLYQWGLPPQTKYFFKHTLIQEAAYESLLKNKRQRYHQRIAQVLEEEFPEIIEVQPELLAHHYTGAGLKGQAIAYWQKAGQRAAERSAHTEAISHLTQGLELLRTLPETPQRTRQELDLQTILGPALMAIKGYAAPEVEKAYARARELCQQVRSQDEVLPPLLFSVLRGLWVFYNARGEHQTAKELGEQLLSLAQHMQDPVFLVEAHRGLGSTLFFSGDLTLARTHLEQAMTLYDPQQHHSYAFLSGQDPRVVCLSFVARILWLLGHPDQALKKSHEALALAQGLPHSLSLALALYFVSALHQLRREGPSTQEYVDRLITVGAEQGFPYWLAIGTILQGWALAERGQDEAGTGQMRQGLVAYQTTGAQLAQSHWLALLAEIYGKEGQVEEGLSVLTEALAIVYKNGEHFYEAELYRLKGELLQKAEACPKSSRRSRRQKAEDKDLLPSAYCLLPSDSPEACFRQAIDIARRQGAKSLELRAVMSLSRLLQKQDKQAEARQILGEIYNWFTEGFDTADLKEAKTLLEELSEEFHSFKFTKNGAR
ncbi:MAG: hypothetical protein L0Y56_12045, partial [Nitrospira sp.]|nr:hypothetical protein [Nitrospira sp.]